MAGAAITAAASIPIKLSRIGSFLSGSSSA
jgi:hypothetical protein